MNKRNLGLAFIPLIVGLIIGCIISIHKPETVIREPETPKESKIEYQIPKAPKINLDMIKTTPFFKTFTPRVVKVCDGVYLATGFALANVSMVITDEGLVIIDTTESKDSAREILNRFRKITRKPIKYIIYTHGHGDHTQGAEVFYQPRVKVIASKQFLDFVSFETRLIGNWTRWARRVQSARAEPDYARIKVPVRQVVRADVGTPDIIMPNITFDGEYQFELGGEVFQLFYAPGETPDTIIVWLPKKRVLFCADDYYASFPNLSAPMLAPRPIQGWIKSLEKMISLEPEYLVPGHTGAVSGKDKVREVLTNYRDAIKSIYEQTLNCINQGLSVKEAVRRVKLPAHLAQLPYLQEYYGTVEWSVRGIYQGAIGWYDGYGTKLNPLPPSYRARELVKLAGGADKILQRAIELQKNKEYQLSSELCDIVIQANPNDKLAHLIKAVNMEYLAVSAGNLNKFGFYFSASQLELKQAGYKEK